MADNLTQDLLFLYDLEELLISRKNELPKGSYTTKLFKKGIDKISQKLGEEAVELVIASKNKKQEEVIYESADLIYHLLVLLAEKDIPLDRVIQELKIRVKNNLFFTVSCRSVVNQAREVFRTESRRPVRAY